jgi:beta-1,4-mannosyl-glycoprotein beta-1,4-N-acetylglucosaminyltransferase
MIYDLVLGFNELDLFTIRYHELAETVDKFIVFEATHTFTGIPKELYFSHWYDTLTRDSSIDKDKIDIFVWDNGANFAPLIPEYCWQRDHTQRGLLGQWVVENAQPDDIILFSDMDEIPNAIELKTFLNTHERINGIWRLEQNLYYLYMNTYAGKWCGTKIFHPSIINPALNMAEQMNSIRYIGDSDVSGTVVNGGWHFSSQGGLEKVKQKFRSYAHHEMSAKPDTELLVNLKDATDPFHNTKLEVMSTETLPRYVQDNLNYFIERGYIYGI